MLRRENRRWTAAAVAWTLVAAYSASGCSDGQASSPAGTNGLSQLGGGSGTGGDAAGADAGAVFGNFTLSLVPEAAAQDDSAGHAAYSSLVGKTYDGPYPSGTLWTVAETADECELLVKRIPTCLPACGSDAVCDDDDHCAAYPSARDVGAVTVVGIGAEFTMKAVKGNYQPTADLPYPPAAEGAPLQIVAAGGPSTAPFSLQNTALAPLELTTAQLDLSRSEPLVLTWTPPAVPERSRIEILIDISHHGGGTGKIQCNVPDSGSAAIAATLLAKLLDLGTAGWPYLQVTRAATTEVRLGAGGVQFRVEAYARRTVNTGVVSCNTSADCPAPQSCRQNLTCG